MILEVLSSPIKLICLHDFGIDIKKFARKLKHAYDIYEPDFYLLRQHKIEFLKCNLSEKKLATISEKFWIEFYTGAVTENEVNNLVQSLSIELQSGFAKIRPTRKRLISEFDLVRNDNSWEITRVSAKAFGQEEALISNDTGQDYRKSKREFKELPSELDDEFLRQILVSLGDTLIADSLKIVNKLNVVVHHTLVCCYPNIQATNSPEGIHQDGMDFIVSALVIERLGVSGGKSIVFGSDKKTKIFEVTLKSGQGVFQPDKGTDLWHTVTPIKCLPTYEEGYRSTIGFDITVIN